MNLIEVKAVSKTFRRHTGRKLLRDHVREWFLPRTVETFHALRRISLTIGNREGVAIIGANGAGKSTLLSLISGLARPDEGSIRVNGRIAPLLELGSGFHPDLTGSENILINAALLGFTEREVMDRFDEIVEFSEIGEFIQEPVRTYSSFFWDDSAPRIFSRCSRRPGHLDCRRSSWSRRLTFPGEVFKKNLLSPGGREDSALRFT
jgi:lipopolysaccharide transport system ATP-binding protein